MLVLTCFLSDGLRGETHPELVAEPMEIALSGDLNLLSWSRDTNKKKT